MEYFIIRDNEDELMHYGVLGMKWGVHRYQNADGSLTAKGRAKFAKTAASGFKQKNATELAKMVYKKNATQYASNAEHYSKKSKKEKNKAEKYDQRNYKYGEHMNKSKMYAEKSDKLFKASELSTKKLSDIDSGKMKAGRDFIMQIDQNISINKIPGYKAMLDNMNSGNVGEMTIMNPWLGNVDYKVIERNK